MTYVFKGFDWQELAQCWNIQAKEQPFIVKDTNGGESSLGDVPEKIDKYYRINGTSITFTLTEEEEVEAEKIRQHIWNNLDDGNFEDPQIRIDIHNFLKALIKASSGYDTPMFEAMLKLESDHTLAQWVTSNLRSMWT